MVVGGSCLVEFFGVFEDGVVLGIRFGVGFVFVEVGGVSCSIEVLEVSFDGEFVELGGCKGDSFCCGEKGGGEMYFVCEGKLKLRLFLRWINFRISGWGGGNICILYYFNYIFVVK